MQIEYDPAKAALNLSNHGVSFEEAKTALLDPYALTKEDRDSQGESRYITLGMSDQGRLLVVVWTAREPLYRLISSWKASQPQRSRYERQF